MAQNIRDPLRQIPGSSAQRLQVFMPGLVVQPVVFQGTGVVLDDGKGGVLNSWETVAKKSFFMVSIAPSSSTMMLKSRNIRSTSFWCFAGFSGFKYMEKLPEATSSLHRRASAWACQLPDILGKRSQGRESAQQLLNTGKTRWHIFL